MNHSCKVKRKMGKLKTQRFINHFFLIYHKGPNIQLEEKILYTDIYITIIASNQPMLDFCYIFKACNYNTCEVSEVTLKSNYKAIID